MLQRRGVSPGRACCFPSSSSDSTARSFGRRPGRNRNGANAVFRAAFDNAVAVVECPTGSGRRLNLYQIAEELARRLTLIFLKDSQGRRPVYGGTRKFQEDPHWRDLLLFYEYFHGDNGAGLGANHQTGWTGVIARVMHLFATSTAEEVLQLGQKAVVAEPESEWGRQLMRRP